MTATATYQPGDEIDINGTVIVLGARKGSNGRKWTWIAPATSAAAGMYLPTPEETVAHAHHALNAPACRHGQHGWCVDCHDRQN